MREVVEDRIAQDQLLDNAALAASSAPAVTPLLTDFSKLLVDAPKLATVAKEPTKTYRLPVPQKRDYFEREARNAALGCAGEEFVLNFEHFRLHSLGHKALADKVELSQKLKVMAWVMTSSLSNLLDVRDSSRLKQRLLGRKPLSLLAVVSLDLLKITQRNFTFIACMNSEHPRRCLICRVL